MQGKEQCTKSSVQDLHLRFAFFFSFTSAWLSAQLSTWFRLVICPVIRKLSAQLSAWFLMLPNLTNHYIKLSDGDLQCE